MFISYAQNFEDVMLNRLFPDENSGFYIDVGAHHPILDSVTKAFYEKGWHGINIEPVKEYFDLLQTDRTRDINLNIALGETDSELEFFELESTGLSSFDQEIAYHLAEVNNFKVKSYKVPLRKLADICQEKVNCPINFLKIDVEGWEEKVILGHDWENYRPIVVVLEATIPNSPVRTETNIKNILESHNYVHVYFDGLNDYYLAQERADLQSCFATPPNVFDQFVRYPVIDLQNHGKNLQQTIQQKEQELSSLQQTIQQKEQEVSDLQQIIQVKDDQYYKLDTSFKDERIENQRLHQNLAKLQQEKIELRDRTANQIAQYHQQIADLQTQIAQANATIIGMESSKFWKLRQAWFRLKTGMKEPS